MYCVGQNLTTRASTRKEEIEKTNIFIFLSPFLPKSKPFEKGVYLHGFAFREFRGLTTSSGKEQLHYEKNLSFRSLVYKVQETYFYLV